MKSIAVKIVLICCFSLLAANVSEAELDDDRMPSGPAIHGPKPVTDPGRADKDTEFDTSWLAKVQQGIAAREYHAGINPKGLQAPNRAHNLRTYFDTTGIRVVDRTAKASPTLLGLSTVSLGRRAADSAKVSGGALFHEKNRVEIRRSGFTEWYLNSAEGLEQGFTLSKRPRGKGELRLTVGVTRARAQKKGDTVILATPGGRRLEYGALKARDAAGRILPTRMAVPSGDRIVMIVDDRKARYPIVIDPLLTGMDDDMVEGNQAGAWMGRSVASAGDVNGDGYADVIVGAYGYDNPLDGEGAAFVFLGGPAGITGTGPSNAHATLVSNQAGAWMGRSVASAGDVNGDGYADVIVGAYGYDNDQINEGAAFVFLGGAAGITGTGPSNAQATLESNQASAYMGNSVASAGDVNGDGYSDVIVGAYGYDNPLDGEGAAFVFLGGAAGITGTGPSNAHAVLEGNQAYAYMGYSVASAGDVNGDGYADVIVGAYLYDNGQDGEGAAFVFLGGALGITGTDPSTAHAFLQGNQRNACMGYSVGSAGDVNGDGYSDVIVGAIEYANGQTYEGAAFVYYGNGGITGKPVLARQWTGDGARPVPRVGLSRDDSRFVVSMQAFPQGVYRQVKLQVEACPAGSPWGDGDCITATSADWTAVTAADLPAGVTLEETLTGLAPDTVYHWRARTLFGPDAYGVSGITPCANPAHGPWRRFEAQPAVNDIRIGSAADTGGSQGGGGGGGCFISIVQSGIGR